MLYKSRETFQVIIIGTQKFLSHSSLLAKLAPAASGLFLAQPASLPASPPFTFSVRKAHSGFVLNGKLFLASGVGKLFLLETISNDCSGGGYITPEVFTLVMILDSCGQSEFYGWVWTLRLSLEFYAYGVKNALEDLTYPFTEELWDTICWEFGHVGAFSLGRQEITLRQAGVECLSYKMSNRVFLLSRRRLFCVLSSYSITKVNWMELGCMKEAQGGEI